MEYQKALITGGAGFVGSHLAKSLLDAGKEVTIIDDLSTGNMRNLKGYEDHHNLELIISSVLDEKILEQPVRDCDVVFHLASSVGVKLLMQQPIYSIENIFMGTSNLLKFASKYRKKILITSTSEVYGKSTKIPFKEGDDSLIGPSDKRRWAYAQAKSLDEFLGFAYYSEYNLPVVITRLFNTVGPNQTGQYGMVIPNFVNSAMRGNDLEVYGDGAQTRCFCHVDDVIRALELAMSSDISVGKVINIGSNNEISINELANRIIELSSSSSGIKHVPYDEAYPMGGYEDMRRRVPCIDLSNKILGWQPKKSLDEIINSVLDTSAE